MCVVTLKMVSVNHWMHWRVWMKCLLNMPHEDADFDALAKEQDKLEAIIHAWDAHNLSNQMDQAAAALNVCRLGMQT